MCPIGNITFVHPLFSKLNYTTLNLATRFWADVRLVFRNSAKPLHQSPRVKVTPGFRDATFQRTYSSGGFVSHARSSVIRHGLCHRRWPVSHIVIRCASHDRSWEEEALQDVMLSQQQLKEELRVSIHDQSLRTASPLHSFAPDHSTPRFDWRRRAPSRAPSRTPRQRSSYDGKDVRTHVKRVVPQQLDIEPGGRFCHEVKAYEDRWGSSFVFEVITNPLFARFLPLLELEQAEDEKEMRERLAKWPIKKLCDRGYCITGMSGFWLDPKFGHIAAFGLGPGVALPDNKFE